MLSMVMSRTFFFGGAVASADGAAEGAAEALALVATVVEGVASDVGDGAGESQPAVATIAAPSVGISHRESIGVA